MADSIFHYFTCVSPFTYLGHKALRAIALKHGKRVEFRPIDIATVWQESGSVPLPQRSQTRQEYRLIELQRIARFRNMNINLHPKFFPTDPTLADRSICALSHLGKDPADFSFLLGEAVWSKDMNIGDENVIAELLELSGNNSKEVLSLANTEQVIQLLSENTQAAIENGAIGAPTYVYQGEIFWGQDRLEYLDEMISSKRPAFSAHL